MNDISRPRVPFNELMSKIDRIIPQLELVGINTNNSDNLVEEIIERIIVLSGWTTEEYIFQCDFEIKQAENGYEHTIQN